jgi:hypothetical protein
VQTQILVLALTKIIFVRALLLVQEIDNRKTKTKTIILMDNLRIPKSQQYYFYFKDEGIMIFRQAFPLWQDVIFLDPLDARIKALFSSPLKGNEKIDSQLKQIDEEMICSKETALLRIDKIIRKIAKFHGKTYKDWSKKIQVLVNRQVTLNFLEAYPRWESVLSSAATLEVIKTLYGLDSGESCTLEEAANRLGISKQSVGETKNKAIRLLDIAHGNIKKTVSKSPLIEDRKRLAEALKSFRGDRTIAEIAKYFGVSPAIYWKLENEDNKYITPEHYKIFGEVFKQK